MKSWNSITKWEKNGKGKMMLWSWCKHASGTATVVVWSWSVSEIQSIQSSSRTVVIPRERIKVRCPESDLSFLCHFFFFFLMNVTDVIQMCGFCIFPPHTQNKHSYLLFSKMSVHQNQTKKNATQTYNRKMQKETSFSI